jgi:hypothetical protein
MVTLTVCIGNSDDRLSQQAWSLFWAETSRTVAGAARHVHGEFLSLPVTRWQNACWVFEGELDAQLRNRLTELARAYGQDSIAVSVGETVLVKP